RHVFPLVPLREDGAGERLLGDARRARAPGRPPLRVARIDDELERASGRRGRLRRERRRPPPRGDDGVRRAGGRDRRRLALPGGAVVGVTQRGGSWMGRRTANEQNVYVFEQLSAWNAPHDGTIGLGATRGPYPDAARWVRLLAGRWYRVTWAVRPEF